MCEQPAPMVCLSCNALRWNGSCTCPTPNMVPPEADDFISMIANLRDWLTDMTELAEKAGIDPEHCASARTVIAQHEWAGDP